MKDLLAGQVIEKSKLNKYDDYGNKVINFTLEVPKKLGSIIVTEVQKVVMFKKLAEKANKAIKANDFVVFSKCKAEERTYVNPRTNKPRTVVDVTANGYGVVTEDDFEAEKATLADMMLDVDEAVANAAKAPTVQAPTGQATTGTRSAGF